MAYMIWHAVFRLDIFGYQTGGLMTRVSDDADEVFSFFIDGIPYFLINVGTILTTCIIMFILNPLLAIASVILMPVLFGISYHMMPRLWHYYGKRHRANRRLNNQTHTKDAIFIIRIEKVSCP